jgi:hypothetical protein
MIEPGIPYTISHNPPPPPLLQTPPPFSYLFKPAPSRSISRPSTVPTPAASLNRSTVTTSLALTASSAALIRIPHFSYIDIVSPGWRLGAALGMNTEASLGLPAERTRLKNGCDGKYLSIIKEEMRRRLTSQPIGDLRVFDHSSSSFQSRFATNARSLPYH